MNPRTHQPLTTQHNPASNPATCAVTDRRVPYAADRLTAARCAGTPSDMLDTLTDMLYPAHSTHCRTEEN